MSRNEQRITLLVTKLREHVGSSLPVRYAENKSYISAQQIIKGLLPGTFVQEPSGEPGTDQHVFVNGIGAPLLSKKDLYNQQAVVYINGIPMQKDHPFAYELQKNEDVRIGTGTNPFAIFNIENIESVEVIKDPVRLAMLGPLASNGAIWIITKNAKPGNNKINVNLHSGLVTVPDIMPVNAAYEYNFRQPFYTTFNPSGTSLMPSFLRDSTNVDYYGPANWYQSYYKPTFTYGADASLTGGSDRANFRLFLSGLKDANSADNTSLRKYNAGFYITVLPLKWLVFNSMIHYTRLERYRNRNIGERVMEQRYIPDITNPLTPNRSLYDKYLEEFEKAVDDNINSSLQTAFNATAMLKQLTLKASFALDYGEAARDAFWPTTLLEGNNFVSAYLGINQRVLFNSSAAYKFLLSNDQSLTLGLNQGFTNDFQRLKYAYGYNGPNDFIKINLFGPNAADGKFITYYFPAKQQMAISSFFGNASYDYRDLLKISAVIRRDGASTMQPNNRWFTGYSTGLEYNLGRQLNLDNAKLSVQASYAKVGIPIQDDRYSTGPVYTSYIGWPQEPTLGTYIGVPAIARPYTTGWIGYDIPWAYYNKLNLGFRVELFNENLQLGADFYNRDNKNGLILMPVASEWGYTGEYKSGLTVNNKGVDLVITANLLSASSPVKWKFNGNISFNQNRLKALPGGVKSVEIENTKLEVGKPVDAFWIYENAGIYNSDSEVPVNSSTGRTLTFQGIGLKAGDPRWVDQNGDYNINEDDKVLKGNYMPKQFGGFGSELQYGKLSMDFQFFFALGRSVMNQYASNRLDFVNNDYTKSLNAVKEITYWERKEDLKVYPRYNPWSDVIAYRNDQDLFVQKASFLKLRSLTLAYDLNSKSFLRKFSMFRLYLTGTNLLTFTPFKGDDPELATYNGIYSGRALPLPRTITFGVKLDF
ncbi:TonB-dependent receptor plug domain-containing protein [Niabella sp. CC-SYL272]|uniref:TonB-dependent receptor plug domain-containing protein n=1 Tax=Niabella agricola TaxID=2891571 RepID=UPI001F2F0999|nr:TonB-dependent receptor plug domain-containing protein [Niabella agricola]MCF3110403.1 TonB-dependent receptor plug domain-containing protein [Niabella agricola]